jgi:polyvinyl alcohol dehydrogenase (cytochrome)
MEDVSGFQAAGLQGKVDFGGSAEGGNASFGLNRRNRRTSLSNGERRWFTDMQPTSGLNHGLDAAVSAIPGVVFSGGWDGVLRALTTSDGAILCTFDMLRDFETVNGVPAKGGSMGFRRVRRGSRHDFRRSWVSGGPERP